ncbi:MAG: flagellar basal body-associated FliL family protein [Halorhodospira halophila]|uniref:flagellar basal body-associated FliL family protein n=1 Tax=Halorhodospira TaxID=85108 RepID=UPI00191304BF|nr:flagellar basal body-associated FliL family protein [Halorhodospira halophila]MCG5538900.1 flagellar basal body-associated FliL family protein [Halorhodospira sp. 9622]MCG5541179.1 flagellar basal body-associated FliL family protein [Halorhodospira sp. M39old]MCG5543268.1 flagellar basal body-associated FliL family protein [Halorhodospira sp. 9628]MCG5545621.1 flagellar basal body-associated FliL family protein [Halorhodospira sp. M38]MCC3751693.1 flagellar basal body-associated FliL family
MPKIVYIFMGIMALMMVVTMGTVGALAFGYITPPGMHADAEPDLGDPQYLKLEPPLTVNFERGQRISYLQAEVEVMARTDQALEGVERHMPVIRNNLLMLFADQSFEALNTRAGREDLRHASLEEINDILDERGIEGEVEAVYFTSFVMQ